MSTPKASLARALHEAADLLVGHGHSDEALTEALRLVEELTETLRDGEKLSKEHRVLVFASEMVGNFGAEIPDDGEVFDAFALSPFSGAENPLRPTHLKYERVGDEIHAEMVAGVAYEGATDRSHGGLTAAVFDDLMGALQRIVGHYGYTQSLEVVYLGRVPIDDTVTFIARLESVEEQTFTMTAEATYDGEVVATSTGIFTALDFERLTADG